MEEAIEAFVGIDWGSASHRVCVLDREGRVLEEFDVAHTGEALAAMTSRLLQGRSAAQVLVAIECRWNAPAETLLERGARVFSINPKQSDRFRDRHTNAGAKDDRRDALVLADALRTDRRAFREVHLGDARLVELRELSHVHDELTELHGAAANRLHQQLVRIFPQMLELGSVYQDDWILALIERVPTPERARRLRPTEIRTLLRKYGIRKWSAEDVQAVLRQPALTVAPGVTAAAEAHMRVLLAQLVLLRKQLHDTHRALSALLDDLEKPSEDPDKKEHRDVTILRSLPGAGKIVAATMLAEAHEALADRDYHRLRLLCGVAPVTRQSGKTRLVAMRRACNPRLKLALFHMAKTLIAHDARSKALYVAHRARGHSQGHALRVVADRALAVLIAMLRADTEYDANKRAA